MKDKFVAIGVVLASLFLAVMMNVLQPDAEKASEPEAAIAVKTAIVKKAQLAMHVESQGIVAPRTRTRIISEVSGLVLDVADAFVVGGTFKSGDMLLKLDPTDYEVALQRAKAKVISFKALMELENARSVQAEKEWGMTGRPTSEAPLLALRRPYLLEAEANLLQAKAEVRQAEIKLSKTIIRASYAGMVSQKLADIGQFVTMGTAIGETFAIDFVEISDSLKNTNVNSPNTFEDSDAPFLLQTKNVQNRFATRFLSPTELQIQFGSGNPADTTEDVIPNSMNVGLGLPFEQDKLTTAYSPTNFIFTNTYGVSPTNTTLTVRYYTGGGVQSNVLSNTITNLDNNNITFNKNNLNQATSNYIFNTVAANNKIAASGGQDGDTIEEIRQNSISQFSTQLRNVTQDDYLVRALSMPSKYGTISKGWTQKPNADDGNTTLDLYVLSNNLNNKLNLASDTLKQNLRTYINQYRMIGDTISIKDAFIINFGVSFEVITYPNFNSNEVIERCISALKDYFLTDKWQINQPIIVPDIYVLLDTLDGVQTVKTVNIGNLAGTSSGYSQWAYDMSGANQNGTIYPSLDPSIFELKYPDTDIQGRVVNL